MFLPFLRQGGTTSHTFWLTVLETLHLWKAWSDDAFLTVYLALVYHLSRGTDGVALLS